MDKKVVNNGAAAAANESDKMIFGDTFGNIMTLEINVNQVSYNNTKPDLVDPHKRVLDLDDFKDTFVKKKVHDQAVMKVNKIPTYFLFLLFYSRI